MTYKNFGKQTSKGFTASATYYIIRRMSERIWWSVRGNLRHGSNELSGIGNRLEMYNSQEREGDNRSTKRYYDGADPDDIWAVRSAGIDPSTGRELFIKKNGELTYDFHMTMKWWWPTVVRRWKGYWVPIFLERFFL